MVFAVGAQDKLIGVSTYCDYPPEARGREKVGSFVSVNPERLSRLKPDLILLVNGQESLASMLQHQGFRVVLLNNNRLSAVADNLEIIGGLTGCHKTAAQMASAFRISLLKLAAILRTAQTKPKIFYCVWPEPLLTVGQSSFLNEVITVAGGINIAGGLKAAYPHFSLEQLIVANPDLVILPYEARRQSFLQRPPWTTLRAVKTGSIYLLPEPGSDNLARPTLRVIDGLYWLATRLHPELLPQLKLWLAESHRALHQPASSPALTR